ncbi:glycoside hydrolase superfamily [Amylocarpus encephaloides]|uniref:Beta-xylanase n=1 Tax=Amylocarpus encephaloides TaxID=45428 RepID=A0A9P8C2Z3_9HELO|nr:glycoside hydrolase superfamily [Amylocarpus encephaloides]
MLLYALLSLLLPVASAQLHSLAISSGLQYFGTATDNSELVDASLVSALSNHSEFGQVTPGNSQKWDSIEPGPNTFSFAKGDEIAALGKQNSQLLRCHTLVWFQQLPTWVQNGTWTNETLIAAMENHITTTVTHYKGSCHSWDVVNEALEADGSFRKSIFFSTIGEAYLKIAFDATAAADPDVKLYYNDFGIETPGPKTSAALNIVRSLKASGTRIDGVGLQSHFIVGSTPSREVQIANLESFTSLGVEVAITELDIRMTLPSTAAQESQQTTDYQNTASACVAVANCVGLSVWGFSDKYSWVPSTFPGTGSACPFDENLARKSAYYGIIAGLVGGSGPPSNAVTGANNSPLFFELNSTTMNSSGALLGSVRPRIYLLCVGAFIFV